MSKTFVYIIESPSDKDCLYANYEGHLLTEALRFFRFLIIIIWWLTSLPLKK